MEDKKHSASGQNFFANIGYFLLMSAMAVLIYDPSLFYQFIYIFNPPPKKMIVSSTRARMANLKTALLNYKMDLGSYPYDGEKFSLDSIERANNSLLSDDPGKNVLFSDFSMTASQTAESSKWKGPYLKGTDAKGAFEDSWGTRIYYMGYNKSLYLHSAGPDKKFETIESITSKPYAGDDILVELMRFKKPFEIP